MKRIGLLGGSFNPAHRGHRRISLAAVTALGLDEVWWLVSPGNPLKTRSTDMAPFEARLASARRMARRAPIRVSDFEARAGTRFTIDTLAKLQRRFPHHRFIWLMGADTVAQFHHWKAWRRLAGRLPIAVISRPGRRAAPAESAMGWLRGSTNCEPGTQLDGWSAPGILCVDSPPDPTSATGLRASTPTARPSPSPGPTGPAARHFVRRTGADRPADSPNGGDRRNGVRS